MKTRAMMATVGAAAAALAAGVMWTVTLPDGRVMERDDGREENPAFNGGRR